MSLKKKHEIELLGEHIIRVVHDTHCNVVVDLGCGKGYLTNYVQTRDQELTVIGIEGNKSYAESFEKRFEQLESKKSAQVIKKARLINAFIPLDISEEDFIKSLGEYAFILLFFLKLLSFTYFYFLCIHLVYFIDIFLKQIFL